MRRTAEDSLLDQKRDEGSLEELKVDPIEKKLAQYKLSGGF
jgi:aminoglycoside phosphotransferase family enzyme